MKQTDGRSEAGSNGQWLSLLLWQRGARGVTADLALVIESDGTGGVQMVFQAGSRPQQAGFDRGQA